MLQCETLSALDERHVQNIPRRRVSTGHIELNSRANQQALAGAIRRVKCFGLSRHSPSVA